ncbi:DNA (cytosine-5-)-methyltransferase [Peptacetobacter hiranonis]|uniref:DNA cytosine methyltransferase n=1 Tax=Peptacetobacter hiranonis TaxID=89152 RepID=UPI0019177A89|nr:DNA (cytosine-5-)-methyltransferase [Peptacetobacter hiranonis]QQQ86329.1 DNA (cytosine-5-)-methyltransferase [Peptacetobacter hiranonis]
MIRLATVFSGIGAIEHALDRMGIEHKIVFACDNGDVDILTKNIEKDIDKIKEEIQLLESIIKELQNKESVDDLYQQQLFGMFDELNIEYNKIIQTLEKITTPLSDIKSILNIIVNMDDIKNIRKKEYCKFINELMEGSKLQQRVKDFQVILEVVNDFKKDNSLEELGEIKEFKSADNIKWSEVSIKLKRLYDYLEEYDGKKIIKKVQDISQRASQLHEKINYLKVQERLDELGNDWKARKAYVDHLYEGLEKKNKVKTSYMANYNVSEDDFHWNVAFLNGKQYRGDVDLFVGGSPCQSFSLVGKQRGLDDTRGTLFYEYARLIDEIRPKIFIYENVRAIISHDNGKTWEKMQEVFNELGYKYYYDILNAKNYGIPQNRERVFVVGFRDDIAPKEGFVFPKPIELEKTMKDFLIDNAPGGYFLPKKGVEFVTKEKNLEKRFTQIDGDVQLCQKKNQQYNWHGDFVFQSEEDAKGRDIPDLEKYFLSEKVKKYVLSTGTKNFYSKPKIDLDIARPLLTTMHKMHRAGVDNYVTTEGRLRKLTPRECLRLMGFSDNFKIVVADTPMYQQAGNSIVVDVLIAILKEINIEKYGDK